MEGVATAEGWMVEAILLHSLRRSNQEKQSSVLIFSRKFAHPLRASTSCRGFDTVSAMTVPFLSPTSSLRREGGRSSRQFPIGAEPLDEGVHFRVWAPASPQVFVQLSVDVSMENPREIQLQAESNGYHSGLVPGAKAGMHYRFRLDSGSFPDPASRFQ